jgi:hypothetical protein
MIVGGTGVVRGPRANDAVNECSLTLTAFLRNKVANITENSALSLADIAHELIGLDPLTAA